MLGGIVIAEKREVLPDVSSNTLRSITYIYLNGERIATQRGITFNSTNFLHWIYHEPIISNHYTHNRHIRNNGQLYTFDDEAEAVVDTVGANIGLTDPYVFDPPEYNPLPPDVCYREHIGDFVTRIRLQHRRGKDTLLHCDKVSQQRSRNILS